MAGAIAELAKMALAEDFRAIDPRQARILLVEAGSRVLPAFPEKLSAIARRDLERLGVEVRTGAAVTGCDAEGITVGAERIASGCVIWAAGVAASPLGRMLAQQVTGATTDRAGRIAVEPDLTLPGHPEINVIGDLALAKSYPPRGEPQAVPGVSPAAKQMGRAAAANIMRRLAGEATRPFRYRDFGNLATIGRNAAVVDLTAPVGHFKFSGYFAWLFWLFAHIYFLIGFRNRIVVLIDWASAYWSKQRYARVVTDIDV
jgi:NADH dehydrogenase